MFLARLKVVLVAAIFLGTVCTGVGVLTGSGADDHPRDQEPAAVQTRKPPVRPTRDVLREAAKVVQSSPDPASRAYTLAEFTKAQARAGDKDGALTSARQAAAAALQLAPGARGSALVAIAWARAEAGDRTGALNVLRLAMKSAEALKKDEGSLYFLLGQISRSQFDLGDRKSALATIQKMSDFALAIVESGNNRVGPLGDLVRSLAYVGEYDRARTTIEVASKGDHHLAGQLFGEMASGTASDCACYLAPSKQLSVEDRKSRLQVLHKIAQAVERFEFAEQKPFFYLANNMAGLGDTEGALRLAHLFGKGPMKYPHTIDLTAAPLILACIGGYQGKTGHLDKARETFREALDSVRRDPKLAMRLGQIASCQAEAGDFVGALETAKSVDPRWVIRVYVEIAEQQRQAGDQEGCRATLQLALQKAEIEFRDPHQADGASSKSPASSEEARSARSANADLLLWQIAAIQAELDPLKAAAETMNRVSRSDYKGWAARDIAEARTKAGDADGTLAWALALQPESVRVWALRGLAAGTLDRH